MNEFLNRLKQLLGLGDQDGEAEVQTAVETALNSLKELATGLAELIGDAKAEPQAALEQVRNKLKAPPEGTVAIPNTVTQALNLADGAGENQILGAINGLKAGAGQAGDLAQRLGAVEKELSEKNATDAVDLAMNAGKIAPAQKDWALDYATKDLAGFTAYANAAPVVVPLKDLPGGGSGPKPDGLDDAQRETNKQMGISKETWEKHHPKDED